MILYHGSKTEFRKFDYNKIGSTVGTDEGFGFYLTDDIEFAKKYSENGYVIKFEFNGKKRITKTLTKLEATKLIKEVQKEGDFLSNYGDVDYEGLSKVLSRAVDNEWGKETPSEDIIGSIINAIGSKEIALKAVHDVLGYDYGIYVAKGATIYTIFNPESLKWVETIPMKKVIKAKK